MKGTTVAIGNVKQIAKRNKQTKNQADFVNLTTFWASWTFLVMNNLSSVSKGISFGCVWVG